MEIISQKVSTYSTSMSIIDTKKRALRPLLALIILGLRFHYVQNNSHSIFIIISNNSLVCICAIPCNEPIPLIWILCILVIWKTLALPRLTQIDLISNLIEIQVTATQSSIRSHCEHGLSILNSFVSGRSFITSLRCLSVFIFIFGSG